MSRSDNWMPLYVGDYLRDTGHLSTQEHGSYLLLIMQAWTRKGILPLDDERLRALARMTQPEWEISRGTLLSFFSRTDNGYSHKRIDAELANTAALIERRVIAGRAGGQASAAKRANQRMLNQSSTFASTVVERSFKQKPRPSPLPVQEEKSTTLRVVSRARDGERENPELFSREPEAPKPTKARRKMIAIPEDWYPTTASVAYATQCGIQDPTRLARNFVLHYRGNGMRMADWDSKYCQWCENEPSRRTQPNNGKISGPAMADQIRNGSFHELTQPITPMIDQFGNPLPGV